MSQSTRKESDSMGEVTLPSEALWGAQTQRAVENFSISPLRIHPTMLHAMVLIKKHAAEVNGKMGLIPGDISSAIIKAADSMMEKDSLQNFPIDVFQTGSGTSWNMNVNEVIANLANLELGGSLGSRSPVHPNDHVNKGQSSNDVVPSAISIANRLLLEKTIEGMEILELALEKKAHKFRDILKLGRTHLQDAVPMTLGQEFSAFYYQIRDCRRHLENKRYCLEELPLGGTAIGTGLNTAPGFAEQAVDGISGETGIEFKVMASKFQGIASRGSQVVLMGDINACAVELMKIANDLRLLASGPRAGFGEIILPSLQPGSSIMPGKINPVIPEMVIQACAHLQGKVLSVSIAGQSGPLQLNMMLPLISHETLTALELLQQVCLSLAGKCIKGLKANKERCLDSIEKSLAMITPVALKIGYDKAAELAHTAYVKDISIRKVLLESGLLSPGEVNTLLDPGKMI